MDEEVPIQTEVNQLAAGAKRNSWTGSGGGVPGEGESYLKTAVITGLCRTTIPYSTLRYLPSPREWRSCFNWTV